MPIFKKDKNKQNIEPKVLPEIYKKFNKEGWLLGQYIPWDEEKKYDIIFVGAKPSDYFLENPDKRWLGNFNADRHIDSMFQERIKEFDLGQIYATDMVKTEGLPGENFEAEWITNKQFRECLEQEIQIINPSIVVVIGRDVEKLFNKEFSLFETHYIAQPSYVVRYNKYDKWNEQLRSLKHKLSS